MTETAAARQADSSESSPTADWTRVQDLACQLTVDLALPGVKVRDLMRIGPDMVIDSRWQLSADMPLRVNGELVAWGEFEVVGDHLAVRLTELA